MSELVLLLALTLLVSFVYSSVGHGGASGYLALLSFFAFPHDQMSATALGLNILVSGLAFFAFSKARHISWNITLPFIVTSVPGAFLGGWMRVPVRFYNWLLAGALFFACFRMLLNESKGKNDTEPPSLAMAALVGSVIGLISGIVGVGGGIFLSPILILFRWADPKKTAATSAFFILVNSAAGLAGKFWRGGVDFAPHLILLALAAFAGGIAGSTLGARRFSNITLRRILAFVLFFAGLKLIR